MNGIKCRIVLKYCNEEWKINKRGENWRSKGGKERGDWKGLDGSESVWRVWWDNADRIMSVGQRGEQLLGLSSDFGRVMSASDSLLLRTPISHRIYRYTVLSLNKKKKLTLKPSSNSFHYHLSPHLNRLIIRPPSTQNPKIIT